MLKENWLQELKYFSSKEIVVLFNEAMEWDSRPCRIYSMSDMESIFGEMTFSKVSRMIYWPDFEPNADYFALDSMNNEIKTLWSHKELLNYLSHYRFEIERYLTEEEPFIDDVYPDLFDREEEEE